VLWDEVVAEVAADYPDVTFESALVDAMAARLVLRPETVDVLVASNLHADILSDLTAALTGGLGVAPSANLACTPGFPSMFEPVHGSAPDLADPALANPVGALLSTAMLLADRGEAAAADRLRAAVDGACADGVLTPDVGGRATTAEVTAAVVAALGAGLPEAVR
jgi:tartrate dehydrogenase/decarboxylase / D-malate dehydrogenase